MLSIFINKSAMAHKIILLARSLFLGILGALTLGVKCVTFGTKLGRANLLTLLTCSLTSQMNNTLKQVYMLTCSLAKSPIFCLIGCSLAHPGLYFYHYLLARSLNLYLLTLLTCSLTSQMNAYKSNEQYLKTSFHAHPLTC